MGKTTVATRMQQQKLGMSKATINQIERKSCQTSQIAAAWRGWGERVARGNNNAKISTTVDALADLACFTSEQATAASVSGRQRKTTKTKRNLCLRRLLYE